MREVIPGIWHWTTVHPAIGVEVSSYWLAAARVVLDPLVPAEGLAAFERRGAPPRHVLLSSGLHRRDTGRFVDAFGCEVLCPRAGLARFEGEDLGFEVAGYDWGESLHGGIEPFEIGALCPDEAALVIGSARAVALADGVIRDGDGPLAFVPDELLSDDDPEAVKGGLRAAYRRLCEQRDFEHLLLAHGNPWIGDGRAALRGFVS